MMREYRGDAHVAAWTAAGIDAVEIGLLTEAYIGLPLRTYIRTRGWNDDELNAAVDRLDRAAGSTATSSLRPGGASARRSSARPICSSTPAIVAIGEDVNELVEILAPWGAAMRDAGGYVGGAGDLWPNRGLTSAFVCRSERAGSIATMLRAFADGQLFGEVLGELPARVIGLHGWRRDRHDLEPVLRGLDAVSLDLPGFGASPIPPEAWGAHEYAALAQRGAARDRRTGPSSRWRTRSAAAWRCARRRPAPICTPASCSPACRCCVREGAVKVPRQAARCPAPAQVAPVACGPVDALRERFGSDDYERRPA